MVGVCLVWDKDRTYCESTGCLGGAGFVELLCCFVGPFSEFLAGGFVGLQVGDCEVGVVGCVAA